MGYYEEIPGFEYWNIEMWKNLIKNSVVPLYNSVSTLLKFREYLLNIVRSKDAVGTLQFSTLAEIERKRSDILPFLLGGIDNDGRYKENSLALLTRRSTGIYI